jgi:hypothetical protein
LQIEQVFKSMGTGMKITCCYGGHKREIEENNLIQPPALIVGTPGRIGDHLRRGNITADTIHTLVLDEFDKSLELGFQEEIAFIVAQLPAIKKRILTSATPAVIFLTLLVPAMPQNSIFYLKAKHPRRPWKYNNFVRPKKIRSSHFLGLLCHVGGPAFDYFLQPPRGGREEHRNCWHKKASSIRFITAQWSSATGK